MMAASPPSGKLQRGRHQRARFGGAEMPSPAALTNFTCRQRDMLLMPDEAALALGGSIAPSLRQRSASYYWRAVSQDSQAKHEAICTKRAGWHLRSFGSHANWALAAEEKCGAKVGVAKLVRRGTLEHAAAQTLWHMVAASGTRGCTPWHIHTAADSYIYGCRCGEARSTRALLDGSRICRRAAVSKTGPLWPARAAQVADGLMGRGWPEPGAACGMMWH